MMSLETKSAMKNLGRHVTQQEKNTDIVATGIVA
jgi:hypothetical protein